VKNLQPELSGIVTGEVFGYGAGWTYRKDVIMAEYAEWKLVRARVTPGDEMFMKECFCKYISSSYPVKATELTYDHAILIAASISGTYYTTLVKTIYEYITLGYINYPQTGVIELSDDNLVTMHKNVLSSEREIVAATKLKDSAYARYVSTVLYEPISFNTARNLVEKVSSGFHTALTDYISNLDEINSFSWDGLKFKMHPDLNLSECEESVRQAYAKELEIPYNSDIDHKKKIYWVYVSSIINRVVKFDEAVHIVKLYSGQMHLDLTTYIGKLEEGDMVIHSEFEKHIHSTGNITGSLREYMNSLRDMDLFNVRTAEGIKFDKSVVKFINLDVLGNGKLTEDNYKDFIEYSKIITTEQILIIMSGELTMYTESWKKCIRKEYELFTGRTLKSE